MGERISAKETIAAAPKPADNDDLDITSTKDVGNDKRAMDVNIQTSQVALGGVETEVDLIKVLGTAVSDLNAVPISQATRANLNANATIQVGGTDVSGTNAVPITNDTAGTLATASGQLSNDHDVTISNTSIAVTGPLTNAELRLSDIGVAVAGLLGDGHNVKVSNLDSDGIPIINQTGDTLSVSGTVVATQSGAWSVTVPGAATSTRQTTNTTAVEAVRDRFVAASSLSDDTANPSTTSVGAFSHVYDGTTWDRARGDSTNGTLVNLGDNNDVVAAGDVANDSADSGNPVKTGAKAIDFNTSGHTADVAAADRVNSIALQNGQHLVADLAHRKSVALSGLDDIYDTASESHNSGDIDVTGFRYASFMFTIESNSNPTDFQWTLEEKSSGGTYFEVTSGFWAFFKYEDVGTGTAINVSVMFPLGGADTIRIVGTVSSDATASPSGKFYTITNSEIGLRN